MGENNNLSRVTMYITRGVLVVPIQVELYDENVVQVQSDILKKVDETKVRNVIIDLSAVDLIDSFLTEALNNTVKMISLLGATTILTGFKPDVAATIVGLNYHFENIQTAINIEEAFQIFESLTEHEDETSVEIEEDENEEEENAEDEKDG